jgi:pyruvate dehydrogenase (quinone)
MGKFGASRFHDVKAPACGVRGIRLEDSADVDEGIAAALAPAITVEMAKGFTLYMVKAVFNGRADDLIDLARSNLSA